MYSRSLCSSHTHTHTVTACANADTPVAFRSHCSPRVWWMTLWQEKPHFYRSTQSFAYSLVWIIVSAVQQYCLWQNKAYVITPVCCHDRICPENVMYHIICFWYLENSGFYHLKLTLSKIQQWMFQFRWSSCNVYWASEFGFELGNTRSKVELLCSWSERLNCTQVCTWRRVKDTSSQPLILFKCWNDKLIGNKWMCRWVSDESFFHHGLWEIVFYKCVPD